MPPVTARATRSVAAPLADPRFRSILWALLAAVGWAGVAMIGSALQANDELGFDLALVLDAGRRVAAGQSPYDPAVVAGTALEAQDLFYSYPPPLAQLAALVAGLPFLGVLVAFGALAVISFVAVATRVARRFDATVSGVGVVLPLVAVLPFLYPMTVALLFGNVDAWYPALYGLLLLAALPRASRGELVAGGAALAMAGVAKIHPASLGLWFLIRALREPTARTVVAVAAVVVGLVGAISFLSSPEAWQDYLLVLRTVSGADLVLRNNIGPAAQLAGLLGLGESGARLLQVPVVAAALAATAVAAWRLRDPTVSLAIAAAASLVILPVTWYHYPVAMLPFAVGAAVRNRAEVRAIAMMALAAVTAAVSIVLPVLVWLAVGLVLAAVISTRSRA